MKDEVETTLIPQDLFSCKKCDFIFVTKRSLDFHCKAFHPQKLSTVSSGFVTLPKKDPKVEVNVDVDVEVKSPSSVSANANDKYFPCRLCCRDFTFEEQLTHHLNTVHSEVTITISKPSQVPTPSLKPLKPRTSLLQKRPLGSAKGEDTPLHKRKNSKPETSTLNHGDFQLNGSFEITEVVRSLLISHMKAESGGDPKRPDKSSRRPTTKLSTPPHQESVLRFGQDSEDEDEFEGEDSDGDSDPMVPQVTFGSDEGEFTCFECGALFQSAEKLERHMDHHSSSANRPYKCSICGDARGFVRKEHLTKHMSSVHSGMKFTCEFCGKDISRRDHLVRHIRTVHRCEIPVGLDFLSSSPTLQDPSNSPTQIKTEIDEISDKAMQSMQPKPKKPYTKCDMCDETFTQLDTLFQHQRDAHGDIRKYDCDFCPKSFKRREHLQKHIVLHTGEKKFGCDHCAKSFPRRDALQDHLRRIHGTAPNSGDADGFSFFCEFCDKVFLQHSNLIRHKNQVHNITLAVAIANGPIPRDYGEREVEGSELHVEKHTRLPVPGLLPIHKFHPATVATKN